MANKYAHLSENKKRRKSIRKINNWVKGCINKKRLSAGAANAIILKERNNVKLYKYYCGACDGYHLTKTPQKD